MLITLMKQTSIEIEIKKFPMLANKIPHEFSHENSKSIRKKYQKKKKRKN